MYRLREHETPKKRKVVFVCAALRFVVLYPSATCWSTPHHHIWITITINRWLRVHTKSFFVRILQFARARTDCFSLEPEIWSAANSSDTEVGELYLHIIRASGENGGQKILHITIWSIAKFILLFKRILCAFVSLRWLRSALAMHIVRCIFRWRRPSPTTTTAAATTISKYIKITAAFICCFGY